MPNPLWPIRVRCHPLILLLLWALAALAVWAIVHVGARDDPPEWDEPEDGVQPGDPRTLWLSDNLTAADGGPVSMRWRQ